MSTDEQSAVGADTTQTVEERLNDMESRLSTMEMDVNQAANLAKNALQTANEALDATDDAKEGLREDIQEIRDDVAELDGRTDLLAQVKNASALNREEKMAVCLQTIVSDAQRNDGRATMTAKEAKSSLGGDVDRTLMYDVLRDAANLVDDDDVLWFEKEDRSSPRNSRLILNLNAGGMAVTVAGKTVTGGE